MRQVMEQYAAAFIAVLTGLVVVFIMSGIRIGDRVGFSSVLGDVLRQEIVQTENVCGGMAFDLYKSIAAPVIVWNDIYAVEAEKRILPEACFVARNNEADVVSVQINKGWTEDGTPIELHLDEDGSFCINDIGIYWISAYAEDVQGYRRDVLLKCVVNKRGTK